MRRRVCAAVTAVTLLLCASASALAQAPPPTSTGGDSGWKGVIYPVFGFAPILGVDLTLPNLPSNGGGGSGGSGGGSSSGGTDTSLNGAAFAAFRIEKGRFEAFGDFNYAGLSAENSRVLLKVRANMSVGEIGGGVRVVNALWVEGGARRTGLDIHASFSTYPEVSWNPARWSPMLGVMFRPRLAKRWELFTHLDSTGLGSNVLSGVDGTARLEWRPISHLALTAGYGFKKLTANGQVLSYPVHWSQTLHGPILGIGIPF